MIRTSGPRSGRAILAIAAALLATSAVPGQNLLTHHIRNAVRNNQVQATGRASANQVMNLDIVLPLRDRGGAGSFAAGDLRSREPFLSPLTSPCRSSPHSSAPRRTDYDAVVQYAKSNGFTVTGGSRDGMDVQVKGPVSAVQSSLPRQHADLSAPDRGPYVLWSGSRADVNLPFNLWHVSGLDNYSIPHPLLVKKSDYAAAPGHRREAGRHRTRPPAPAPRPRSWAAICAPPTTVERR